MKIKPKIKKIKQRFRPVKWVKRTFKKKKNQRRLLTIAGITIIFSLGIFLIKANERQAELQKNLAENQAAILQAQKDISKLKTDVSVKDKTILNNQKALKAKEKKQKELEEKIEQLTKQNNILKSYGSGVGGAYHVSSNQNVKIVAGNAYGYGYCTWYVKNKRPDIGSYWGDAKYWYSSAQAAGFATGTEPRAGAIGVSFEGSYGHVVYIESVSGNTVHLSEMNGAAGWNTIGTRDADKSEFVYIYGRA